MQTSLRGIANKARADKHHRFDNLFGLLNEEGLRSCWRLLNTRAANGVDRVTAREYAKDLVANIGRLVERLKRGSYRAKLVRRRHIPKEGGKTRRLGIPAVEDKLLRLRPLAYSERSTSRISCLAAGRTARDGERGGGASLDAGAPVWLLWLRGRD